ncbi:MAG: GrrA/OscA1 family cyclophane-containing rSAM-modified RiPP [Xenococcaceae cyanobacterium MO_167.B27]|nr:GrrA/OscA1 family cyclophane-containing rSAM-modified RiPP [Xenococcaceae cyanobacterium MO_167.B27]
MKLTKITWISLIVTLATLNLPTKTKAHQADSLPTEAPQMLESRLAKIAATLKERESQIPPSSTLKKTLEIAGWGNAPGGGGFLNNRGGGGFVNSRGGGGFVNNRWSNGGGFLNRRY